MAIKEFSIDLIKLNLKGQVDCFDALTTKPDKSGFIPLRIYVERNDKDLSILPTDILTGKTIKLPLKIAGKILRLVKDYDKLGKRSINL